jgi:hypothetical protein
VEHYKEGWAMRRKDWYTFKEEFEKTKLAMQVTDNVNDDQKVIDEVREKTRDHEVWND